MTAGPYASSGTVLARLGPSSVALDPLAMLLRQRYPSRAELARACGLGYQMLRTYTDGRWTADQLPPV